MKIPWNSRPDFPVAGLHGVGQHGIGMYQPGAAAVGEIRAAHHTRLKTCHPNSICLLNYGTVVVWRGTVQDITRKG